MMNGSSNCAWKLLAATMIMVRTTIVHTRAIVLLRTVLNKIRNSAKADAALNVRKNFITLSMRIMRATLRLMAPSTEKTLVSVKSTRVETTMKMSNRPRGSLKMTRPSAQYLSASSAANHTVNEASTSSKTLMWLSVTPVLLSTPTSSPARRPSNSSRTTMVRMLRSMTTVQNMSNSREAKLRRNGLVHDHPCFTASSNACMVAE
mmetsp:Transcript_977/g.2735  ORF Transcript_977/g.2735 Transcript_977/m.2735 type:complete len:205 (-) Transcript_977:91-705(-)